MPTPAIVQTLPYVAWILLVALALGSFAFAFATRQLTDATTGYLRFSAFTAALIALLALATDPGGVASADLAVRAAPPELGTLRNLGLAAFAGLAIVYAVVLAYGRAAPVVGGAAVATSALALVGVAFGWAPTAADAIPLLVQLVVLSIATGGSLAAIILGHWYLVTPKISEGPLILQARLLLAALVLQALLFVTWTTLGGGPGQGPWQALTSANALLVVLRLLVSICFPIVLVYMAWRTARTRSMESATGLLYINLAAVMAGTIGAAALYVSAGLLV